MVNARYFFFIQTNRLIYLLANGVCFTSNAYDKKKYTFQIFLIHNVLWMLVAGFSSRFNSINESNDGDSTIVNTLSINFNRFVHSHRLNSKWKPLEGKKTLTHTQFPASSTWNWNVFFVENFLNTFLFLIFLESFSVFLHFFKWIFCW